jgi:acyl carrier protein phosphodiesterase
MTAGNDLNFLFHLHLSGNDPELLVGNFMGDFVKGVLKSGAYPPRIHHGLVLHRKIDAFAHHNSSFQTSKARLNPSYGLYRGVLADLFYDHFLAKEWADWSDVSLVDYLAWARSVVNRHLSIMPQDLQGFVPIIFHELLPSYKTIAGTEAALARMSRRIGRPNPLNEGSAELKHKYALLRQDFRDFTVEAERFAAEYRAGIPQAD